MSQTDQIILPLEDNHLDILGKAQNGLKLGNEELASRAGISSADLSRIQAGEVLSEPLGKLAKALGLGPQPLTNAARKAWRPQAVTIPGLKTFTTRFEDMTVNSYLAWDAASKKAAAFDAGADAGPMLEFAAASKLKIELILITHTHIDHVYDLARLREKTGAPVFVGDQEPPLAGAEPFAAGKSFQAGALVIESRLTRGHADGGITYVIKGLSRTVAVVGDAIFAGSMGGGKVSYADALRTTRGEILSLPDETVLASGHGPLTTVAEEKKHNPFFAV